MNSSMDANFDGDRSTLENTLKDFAHTARKRRDLLPQGSDVPATKVVVLSTSASKNGIEKWKHRLNPAQGTTGLKLRVYNAIITFDQNIDPAIESAVLQQCLKDYENIIAWLENSDIVDAVDYERFRKRAAVLETLVKEATGSVIAEKDRKEAEREQLKKNQSGINVFFNSSGQIVSMTDGRGSLSSILRDYIDTSGVFKPSSGSGSLRNQVPSLVDFYEAYRRAAPSTATFTIEPSDEDGYEVLKKILDDTGVLFSPNDDEGTIENPVDLVPVLANSAIARERVRELRGVDAQHAMNALYAASMITTEDATLQNQIVRLLTDLSVQSGGMLPAELMIAGVTMTEYERQHGFAKGGFADVHKGSYNGGVVSIKVPNIMANDPKKARVEFCREALLWQTLKHKNILPFLGTSVTAFPSRVLCLIAPYMEDMTILKFLHEYDERNIPVSDFDVYVFLCQIVDGMAYLHQRGVIHGDLKCENIVINKNAVTGKREACLIDFGITSYAEPGTLPQVEVGGGTYQWISPEIIKAANTPSDSKRDVVSKSENVKENEEIAKIRRMSDVYSLSMTIIQLFTRMTPWHYDLPEHLVSDDNKREAIRANIIADKRPEKGAEAVPAFLRTLLRDCWHTNYELRPEMVKIQECLITLNPQPQPQPQLQP